MAYEIQLNVGLEVSERFPEVEGPLVPAQVIDALLDVAEAARLQLLGLSHRVQRSSTEETVVIRVFFKDADDVANFALYLHRSLYSDKLGQDCVAVYDPLDDYGVLIGTYWELWGEFNKEYFIEW